MRLLRLAPLVLAALAPASALAQARGIHPEYMDTSVAPCENFYRYANGKWIDTAQIPGSYPIIGAGREMADRNQAALLRVLERTRAQAATEKDPTLRKLGQFYSVLMDSARADREGLSPIASDLKRISQLQNRADVVAEIVRLHRLGVDVPFRLSPEPDPKQSSDMLGQLYQAGLGLPDRDYYFRTDPKSEDLRQGYRTMVQKLFVLSGETPEHAKVDFDRVLALETALAESSLTRVQQRDPKALYNKITVAQLATLAPGLDWVSYFREVGVDPLASPTAYVDASTPAFLRQVSVQLEKAPIETWRAYLAAHVLRGAAGWSGQQAFDIQFAFVSKLLGLTEPQPRWKRATQVLDNAMGEALGKAFVETEFPPSSKQRMLELVANLQATLRERIGTRTWMSDATKRQAVTKLDAIINKIGYPDTWRDYSKLEIDPKASAIEDLRSAQEFQQEWLLDKIGKSVDKTLWLMTPPTVNAYYNPPFNEIVFPAGILQPPQFDPRADDAVNYGAIGMVIGHELTHGFDDEGRQYDAAGNLKDWWTEEDSKRFDSLANQVVEQYNGYVAVDTLKVNGKLTLGENMADLGGLTIAYHAWKRSLEGKPAPKTIDGLTPDQRFFVGFAQAWRRKMRPELTRLVTLTDPHSPAVWRVNGPVSNMKEFREAFGCKSGDTMVRAEGIEVW